MNDEAKWSARYREAGDEYLFGTEPNRFLAQHQALFKPGQTALSVADGEGRNSIWLAAQGLVVTASEVSEVAIAKARRLAEARRCQVAFTQGDMLSEQWPPREFLDAFDWVIAIFIQFADPRQRIKQFASMQAATRPGGRILLQGYTPQQLLYGTGGPSALEHLYTQELLREAFAGWDIEELVEYEDDLSEGTRHGGRSALIGMVARKPA